MSDDRPVRRKRRKMGGYYVLILVLIVVVGGFLLFRWRQKAKLQRKMDAIRAAGYPVTYDELDAWYSIPNDVNNAADLILEAIADYRESQNSELMPIVGQADPPRRTEELSAEVTKLIGEHLAENEQTLALLGKAADLEYSRYPVDIRTGYNMLLNHLQGIRTVARLAQLEVLSHAQKNEGDACVESVKRIYGTAHSLNAEPLRASQCVRIVCCGLGVSAIECVVNRANLSDEQLLELSGMVAGAEERSDLLRWLVGSRCVMLDFFRNPEKMSYRVFSEPRLRGILLSAYRGAGFVATEGATAYLDYAEEFMAVNGLDEHRRIEAVKAIHKKLEQRSGISVMMVRMLIVPNSIWIIEAHLQGIAALRTATVALAIERYRLAIGKLPGTLSELVPAHIDAVPKDPFDGAEMRYRRLEKGYVVYSIGEDGSDDGGREKIKGKKENWDVTFIVER